MRARSRLVVDMGLIAGAVLAFASGLVLLLAFHIGHGCFRPEALGLSRLVWQNLHRLGAVLGLAGNKQEALSAVAPSQAGRRSSVASPRVLRDHAESP